MYSRWLDSWDERNAASEDKYKLVGRTEIGMDLAFDGADDRGSLSAIGELAKDACRDSDRYYSADTPIPDFQYCDGVLTFRSFLSSETTANNTVHARVTKGRKGGNAVVVFPHWNAKSGYGSLSSNLARLGLTVVELTLPYHGVRQRSGAAIADDFLSANLGQTIRSIRQSVIDGRNIVDWLEQQGHQSIGVIGMSLGSCVAGLVAAHEKRVSASALLLTAGDFAEVVWTGRATQHISDTFKQSITLQELQAVWSIISTRTFVAGLARSGHRMLILSGKRDQVVKPYLTRRFIEELKVANVSFNSREMGCGHYSMALFPYNIITFLHLARFFYTWRGS